MPKQYYTLRSFAKGMNSRRDPRDIADDEAGFINNMSIDSLGKIKSAGSMYSHGTHQSGSGTVGDSRYVSERGGNDGAAYAARINGSGGYNLFYFESDHSNTSDYSFVHQTSDGSNTDAEITFHQPSSAASSGLGDQSLSPSDDSPT
jgi:hypothetical protein